MTRLHFKEIASPRTKLPRTSTCSVESEVVLLFLLLLVGLRRLSLAMKIESRSKQTSPSLILANICDHPKLVIRKQISVESVSNTEPNTSIGQCHPISASEDQRQDLEALQGSAARATGTHEPFPVTWHGGAASAESICRHAQNVSL